MGTRSPPSAPLSSSQDATQGLQSDPCCPRSSLPVNLLNWLSAPTHPRLASLFTPAPAERKAGTSPSAKVREPRGLQETREARPRNSRHLQPGWKQPARPRGGPRPSGQKEVFPGSRPASDSEGEKQRRERANLPAPGGLSFQWLQVAWEQMPSSRGRQALGALGSETCVGGGGGERRREAGEPEKAPRRRGQGIDPRARLPTGTRTDLGAATFASCGRRCALWRRCPPGCRCRARGSCWDCSASCRRTAGPSAAPAPAASGGSSRWRWPRPWWPPDRVRRRAGPRGGSWGHRAGRAGKEGRPEGRGRGLGALSPAWDPSPSPRSAGPGPQMRPGRGGANAGSPRSCPPPPPRRSRDWGRGRGRGRRRSRRLPARPASRAGGRAGCLLPGQGMEGRCRPGPARWSAQSALGRTQSRTRAAPRPVPPLPPALGVHR